ncbi:MAG TPA: VWA domain-containing protein [Vicinamibacterales bacterium]|jgi:Ca-activated chloride channel family protein|nr:VWA domain-containing protein [Vicinamibacterales bacterium]
MRSVLAALVSIIVASQSFGGAAATQETQKFKSGTQTVPLYVTVTDATRRLVPELAQEDFEILDNGKPQSITLFDDEIRPITAVVMLDTSGSMTLALDLVKKASEQFVIRLLPDDRGRVGAFNDKIEFFPSDRFTGNRDELIGYLKELDFGYPTRLYDAVDQSIDKLEPIDGRRVVVVFTDGDDTASKAGLGDVLDRARLLEVMVYAIGLESDYFNGVQRVRTRPDRGLKKLAEETGGGFFELKKTDELGATFTRVAQELHSQYVLGFSPEKLDGKVHKLDVRVKRPGMTARARKSYVAAPATATDSR